MSEKWTQSKAIKFMQAWKDAHPCVDCSQRQGYAVFYKYWVLQFDHPPGSKVFNLGSYGRKLDEVTLRQEMAKCDVVCANCHCERTHYRQIQPRKVPA